MVTPEGRNTQLNNHSQKLQYTVFSNGQNTQIDDQQKNRELQQDYKPTKYKRHLYNIQLSNNRIYILLKCTLNIPQDILYVRSQSTTNEQVKKEIQEQISPKHHQKNNKILRNKFNQFCTLKTDSYGIARNPLQLKQP